MEGALSDRSPHLRIRWVRVWSITAVVAAVFVAATTLAGLQYALRYLDPGIDFDTLMGATRNFLAGDGFYPADQLAGPWRYHQGEPAYAPPILYPPHAVLLFIPFTILPAFLWWLIPIAVTAGALWRLRPHPAAWLAIVLLLGVPESREGIFWGNPVMWMVAATAAGLVLGWPAVLVFLKPTLAPFALVGIGHRSWWLLLGVLAGIQSRPAPDVGGLGHGDQEFHARTWVQPVSVPIDGGAPRCLAWIEGGPRDLASRGVAGWWTAVERLAPDRRCPHTPRRPEGG